MMRGKINYLRGLVQLIKRSEGIVTRSLRLPERGWSRHLCKVAAFDPNPCTVDPDGGQSSAALWET